MENSPTIKIQMSKDVLLKLIEQQGDGFNLSIAKAALNHALRNGCKKLVPSQQELEIMIKDFLIKEFQDKLVTYSASRVHGSKPCELTPELKNRLRHEVDALWTEKVSDFMKARYAELEFTIIEKLESYKWRLEQKMISVDERLRSIEAAFDDFCERRITDSVISYIDESVSRMINEKKAAKAKIESAFLKKGEIE